jgi:hypothetical protein
MSRWELHCSSLLDRVVQIGCWFYTNAHPTRAEHRMPVTQDLKEMALFEAWVPHGTP